MLHHGAGTISPHMGQAHPEGREYSRKTMYQYGTHAQGISYCTGMLTTGSAKAVQRIIGDIITPLHGNLLDGIGHVLHCDAKKTFCHCHRLHPGQHSQFVKLFGHHFLIQHFILPGAENSRE